MLALNPRGRVPVLKDGDYVVFESLAVLYYLDLKYPEPTLFGRSPEEAAVIMRVICEFQAYTEEHLMMICRRLFESGRSAAAGDGQAADLHGEQITSAMHVVAREARTIEGRLSKSDWIVGESYSAVDMVIFPAIQLLRRALDRPQGRELSSRFLLESNYPRSAGAWRASRR